MNIQPRISMLMALQAQLPDFLPFAGFTPAEAGHTVESTHPAMPTLRHFLSAELDGVGFTIALGMTGTCDVTMPLTLIAEQHNMSPAQRLEAARKVWTGKVLVILSPIIDRLLTPELIEQHAAMEQRIEEIILTVTDPVTRPVYEGF